MWQPNLRGRCSESAAKWLTGSGRGRLIVLCYHDLREPGDFTSWLRVETGRFEEHLNALSTLGSFVAPAVLDRLLELPGDRLHFLLTFDDGYLNNLRLAADVLQKTDVPALFFISTHHLVSGEPFWFERVVTRVQAARIARLDLAGFGLREYRFHPNDGARRWDDIQRLLTDLKRLGNPTEPRVARVLDLLDSDYGATAEPYDQRLRPMNVQELTQLASRPQTFFGSHGHRHEILPLLTDSALAENVSTSRQILESVLDRSIDDIAYPNGDEDQRVRDACTSAGYRRGYLTARRLVKRDADALRIPRLLVGGYDSARDVIANVNSLLVEAAANELFDRAFRGRKQGLAPHGPHQAR